MTALALALGVFLSAAVIGLVVVAQHARRLLREGEALVAGIGAAQAGQRDAERMRARLEASLGSMPDGVVIFGEDGISVYHNDPAAIYLDARHGDALVEEAITDMVGLVGPGETHERELEVFGPPRRTLVLRAVSLEVRPSSSHKAGDQAAAPEPSAEPAPSGVLVIVEDVTERRQLENVRSDFVANISHELKTPVGALALLAETLAAEDDPVTVRQLAERLVDEAFRMAHTIEDLSELSRLEVAPGDLDEEVTVAAFIDEAVDRVRAAAEGREITLRVSPPPSGLKILGDRRQLVSAVANLVDNAVKYSEEGSPVEVGATCKDGWVAVEVRDYGEGIPKHDLQRIFERFYRVDRARSRETGGTGLGLAIVRHVAANHAGEVVVDSREGEGSQFSLRLPERRL